jgi:phosphoribosylglycinamide formyltransferase-1
MPIAAARRMPIAILASGRGSNLQALIDACAAPNFPARIVLVGSNVPGAQALTRAEQAGIPTAVIDHKKLGSREAFDAAMQERIVASGAELVCLAGFMRILTAGFVTAFQDRLINIHPSLLPAFPGLNTHARELEAGVRFAGCTVHYVRTEVDVGPIIAQAAVPVQPGDDADTLAARVTAAEHRIYPQAVRWIAEGRVRVSGAHVLIDGATTAAVAAFNPQPTMSVSAKK